MAPQLARKFATPSTDWDTINLHPSLSLSPPMETDKEALLEHLSEPQIARTSLRIPYPYSELDARQWIRIAQSSNSHFGKPVVWAIRNELGTLIGCIAYEVDRPGSHKAELGYWLARPFWGQGIMTRVVCRIVDIGLGYGWSRLSASVFDSNPASARVLEKCGFCREARLRKFYYKAGHYHDALVYSIVR